MNGKVVELKINYSCNLGCKFCWVGDQEKTKVKVTDIMNCIDNMYNIETIHVSGGEPTIYKDLLYLLKEIKKHNYINIILHTNAIRLSDIEYVEELNKYITNYFISFHAINPATHKEITRVNNKLIEQQKGIENCINKGGKVIANTVINKMNMAELKEIVRYLKSIGTSGWMVTFPFIAGNTVENKGKILPDSYIQFIESVVPAVEIAEKNNLPVIPNGFPYCYLKDYFMYFLKSIDRMTREGFDFSNREIIDAVSSCQQENFIIGDILHMHKTLECKQCIINNICAGFWKEIQEDELWPNFNKI